MIDSACKYESFSLALIIGNIMLLAVPKSVAALFALHYRV